MALSGNPSLCFPGKVPLIYAHFVRDRGVRLLTKSAPPVACLVLPVPPPITSSVHTNRNYTVPEPGMTSSLAIRPSQPTLTRAQMLVTSLAFVLAVYFSRPNLAAVRALPVPAAAYYVDLPPRSGQTRREGTRHGGGGGSRNVRDTFKGLASSLKPAGMISGGLSVAGEARVTPSSTP